MDLLKRVALIIGLSCPLWADQVSSTQFRGLNVNESSVVIDPSDAQDLLNVDVSVGGKSVGKRKGYGLYKSTDTGGRAIRGGYHFYNSTGTDVQLWGGGTGLFSIVDDSGPVTLVSSTTANAIWDCTDTQGNAYCVNSGRDVYLRTDGTSILWNLTPYGTMVESTPDRVVVAGNSSAPNTLYVSESNNFTNFTTGVNATDAFTEVIASPGSKLTHIRWGCGKLLWWKDQSFGYFDFDDQYTALVKTVSDTIGSIDNTSAIDPGGQIWFRAQDGHTYKYDCSSLSNESVDISPLAESAGRRSENAWTQTTASDFASGRSVNIDTSTVSGQASLVGRLDNFSSLSDWSQGGAWSLTNGTAIAPFSLSATRLIEKTGTSGLSSSSILSGVSTLMPGGIPTPGVGLVNVSSNGYVARFFETGGNIGVILNRVVGGVQQNTVTSLTISAPALDTSIYHSIDLEFREATGGLLAYFDGVLVSSGTDTTYTSLTKQYIQCVADSVTRDVCSFRNSGVYSSTGTYFSAVHNSPDISLWGPLEVLYSLGSGSQTFYMRASTNSFTSTDASPSWTAQTAGNFITISTGTYFQLRDDFAITSATQTPTLSEFTINSIDSNIPDSTNMIYFDNAIWQSVAYGEGQTTSNYLFKFDLINDGWTVYDFGTGGMLVQSNSLYFGDPDAGYIYKFGTSNSDNGTAINAFWKSKDFSGADPFLQTQLTNIDTFASKDQGTTLSVSYSTDGSTTTAYSMSLTNENGPLVQSRKLLPSGKLGQVFNVQYGDNSVTSNWELLGYRIGFIQLPYRPTTP